MYKQSIAAALAGLILIGSGRSAVAQYAVPSAPTVPVLTQNSRLPVVSTAAVPVIRYRLVARVETYQAPVRDYYGRVYYQTFERVVYDQVPYNDVDLLPVTAPVAVPVYPPLMLPTNGVSVPVKD